MERCDLITTINAHLRQALEYPSGLTGGLSPAFEDSLEKVYIATLKLILGDAADKFPYDVVRELAGGVASLKARRNSAHVVFYRALESVSGKDNPERNGALEIFRGCMARKFVAKSITHAMDQAVKGLAVPQPSGWLDFTRASKVAWSRAVAKATTEAECTRRHKGIKHYTTAARLMTSVSTVPATLTAEWIDGAILRRPAIGPTAFLLTALCEKSRVFPHERSHYPGGPARDHCDICGEDLAGHAGAPHFFLFCTKMKPVRDAWMQDISNLLTRRDATFAAPADALLSFVGLSPLLVNSTGHSNESVALELANIFTKHFGAWERRNRGAVRRLAPSIR